MDFFRLFKTLPSQTLNINPPILGVGAWSGHIPFAYDLIFKTKPNLIVELGVDRGESLLAFSDACQKYAPSCKIFGIDSWEGDSQTGNSSIHLFESVQSDIDRLHFKSTQLIRKRFEFAVEYFEDHSIDILHIDGWHTYQAVKNDWNLFQPKVKKRGIILFHDSRAAAGDFGVYRFLDEVKESFPTLEFPFFFGLFVLENSMHKKFSHKFLSKIMDKPHNWWKHYESTTNHLSVRPGVHKERLLNTISVSEDFADEAHFETLKKHHTHSDVHTKEVKVGSGENSRNPKPTFSILTPVYKPNIEFLNAAADSVLLQSHINWEWILIDDGNTAEIRSALNHLKERDTRIRLVSSDANQHIAKALNLGLENASKDWCLVLDQDDLLTADALLIASIYIQEYPKASIFYSDEDKTDFTGQTFFEPYFKPGFQPDLILSQNYFNHVTFTKVEDAREVNGFDDMFRGCQDWDLYLKVIHSKGYENVIHIPYTLYHWRQHSDSTSEDVSNKPYIFENSLKCIRKRVSGDTDLKQLSTGYILRQFGKTDSEEIQILYQIGYPFETKIVESDKWTIRGTTAEIIHEISRLTNTYNDRIFYICPRDQPISLELQIELHGYANQAHVAFAAPQVYSRDSRSFRNAFSINDQGFAQHASAQIGPENEGYFMNLRLPTNPDVLDLSIACFRANNWLRYVEQVRDHSLLKISKAISNSEQYFVWVPKSMTINQFDSLFELGDGDHKSILEKRHWVSPRRKSFVSEDESLNSTSWTGLRCDYHK